MSDPALQARRSAVYLLDQILGEGRLLAECLSAGALDRLPRDDRARAQRLALETLRGLERADRLLKPHLQRSPPLTVQNVLRLGAVELAQGEASYGVVNSMVEIVGRSRRHGRLRGLVNAVLRKVALDAPERWSTLPVPRMPQWLRDPLVQAWGKTGISAMERAHFAGAPLDLTVRADRVAPVGERLPSGSIRLRDAGQVSALPGYAEGGWWVQDAAAALPVQLLNPQPGEDCLDLCAAPGGKTLQISASGAKVTAVDSSASRMERVRENLNRTGLTAELVVGEVLDHKGQYDAVLLDAPCSATGTLRRHPDLPFAKDGGEFAALIEMQSKMLSHAVSLVKPGGRLVFCTCSLLPDEGEVQIEDALARHRDIAVDRAALDRPGIEAGWISPEGGLRLRPDYWPEIGGMDGFYMAALRKTG
ncbi:MAG: transcription antitermination factor NusB [Pseudomonadota bacterium]